MNFSNALALMDSGFRCTRQEWKAKGEDIWVGMVRASQPITIYNMPKPWLESGKDNSRIAFGDWLGVKTANDVFIPWEAAQSDVFATDWTVYDLVVGENDRGKQIGGAEVLPATKIVEIPAPVDSLPKNAIAESTPPSQVAAETVNPDVYADATKFVNNKLNENRTKRQREAEKAAMRAKVSGAINNGKPGVKSSVKTGVKPGMKQNKPNPVVSPQSRAEAEKAAMRARMNNALNKH